MEWLWKRGSLLFFVLCCTSSTAHAFGLVSHNFYASQVNSNKIDEYDPNGKFIDSLALPDVEDIRGLAFGPDRLLYAVTTQPGNFLTYSVVAIDHLGAVVSTYQGQGGLNTNLVYGKLTFATNGQFFVMGPFGLAAFTPGEAASTIFPLVEGYGVQGLPAGNLLFTTGDDIREVTTSGVPVRTITPSVRLDHASSIAYDGNSNQIFVTDLGQLATQLRRLDGSTGIVNAQTRFNDGTDSVLATDGRLVIASRFDPPSIFDLNLNLIGAFDHGVEGFITQAQFHIRASERDVLINLFNSTGGTEWTENYNWCATDCASSMIVTFSPPGTECTWYGVACDDQNTTVTALGAPFNNLVGTLPDLSPLKNLQYVSFYDNHLSGSIPNLAGLSQLQTIDFAVNQLSGSIPDLSDLTNLQNFEASSNQLTGSLPDLSKLTKLQYVEVNDNNLSGPIPDLSGVTNLQYFFASNNQLSGPIPDLSKLSQLVVLSVSSNQLTGTIPDLTALPKLQGFGVGHNHLTGPIPDLSGAPMLSSVDVGGNMLTGSIPDMPSAGSMSFFIASDNMLTGRIPDLSAQPYLYYFDVHGNQLSGRIPPIAALSQLIYFFVDHNALTGPLPTPPTSLVSAGTATICPNLFAIRVGKDSAWSAATGFTPWWATPYANNRCDDLSTDGFEGAE